MLLEIYLKKLFVNNRITKLNLLHYIYVKIETIAYKSDLYI